MAHDWTTLRNVVNCMCLYGVVFLIMAIMIGTHCGTTSKNRTLSSSPFCKKGLTRGRFSSGCSSNLEFGLY